MIEIRLPIWLVRVPWRWIIAAKIVLLVALTLWLGTHKLVDGLWRNVDGFKELAEFEVYWP